MNIFSNDGYSQGRLMFYDLSQSVEGQEKIRSALETSKWEDKQGDIYSLCIDVVERIFPIGLNRNCAVFYIGSKLTKPETDDAKHERVNRAFQKMIQGTFKSNVEKYQATVDRAMHSPLNLDFLEESESDEELGAISTRLEEDQRDEELSAELSIFQAGELNTTPTGIADELALTPPVQEREAPAVEELTPPTPQEELSEPSAKKKTRKSLFQRLFSPMAL